MSGGTISGNTASGNTATGSSINSYGGGVYVSRNATFTMINGTISGNTASTSGGGVFVSSSSAWTTQGIFRIVNGTIYGKNEGDLSNTAGNVSSALFSPPNSGVYPTQCGTFDGGTWVWKGYVSNSDETIRVVNGELQE